METDPTAEETLCLRENLAIQLGIHPKWEELNTEDGDDLIFQEVKRLVEFRKWKEKE